MPDEKQLGQLRDILDSAKTIREYLRGVTHVQFLAHRTGQRDSPRSESGSPAPAREAQLPR